jgi:hypothetical protein
MIKRLHLLGLGILATFAVSIATHAVVLVEDTWIDGTRDDPASPIYSENGIDLDGDGDLESAWFRGGSGTLTVTNSNPGTTPGILRGEMTTSSASWTTYFTPEGSPVTLLNAGDQIKLTWVFTLTGVVVPPSPNQAFRMAIVDSPSASRVTSDASPGNSTYAGYAIFGNMATTLDHSSPFQLRTRAEPGTSSALLSSAGSWTSLINQEGAGVTGYEDGVEYTFVFQATRTAGPDSISGNEDDELAIVATMTGGSIGGDGMLEANFTHTTPNTFTFDTFQVRPDGSGNSAEVFDTTLFKVEGPASQPTPPSIDVEPQDLTRTVGQFAHFTVSASGTAPLHYQWYFNTNTPIANATNATLELSGVQTTDAGRYSVTITNEQGSTNSRHALLTVNLPVHTPLGVVLDDRWDDGNRSSGPIGISNSVWYASVSNSLTASVNSMIATASPTANRLWVGYFTPDPETPVDLAVGHAIRATLVFTPSNVATQNTSTLRFGLFNYADNATRLSADGSSSGNAVNVTGYMLTQNFGESFGQDSPMNLYVRNDLASANLLTSTAQYASLGSGPAGSSNAPAFTSGTEYTLELTVARTSETATRFTTRITGGSLDILHSEIDDTYAYRRFDTIAIRSNRSWDSADSLNITRLLVEVIEPPATSIPLDIELSGNNVILRWENPAFTLQAAPTVTGTYTNVPGATSPYTNAISGSQQYFRLFTN